MDNTQNLNDAIAQVLNSSLQVKDFVQAQLPDVVRQLVNWYFYGDLFAIILGVIIISIATYFLRKTIIAAKALDKYDTPSFDQFAVGLVSALSIVVFVILLPIVLTDFVQLMVAPKVWLLEYAAKLLHPGH